MNYTKGEWVHTEDGVVIASDGKQIASVFPRDREANAQLIASAPALYEALKNVLFDLEHGFFGDSPLVSDRQEEIEKALAQAEK